MDAAQNLQVRQQATPFNKEKTYFIQNHDSNNVSHEQRKWLASGSAEIRPVNGTIYVRVSKIIKTFSGS